MIISSNNPPGHVPMERDEVDKKKEEFKERLENETNYARHEQIGLEIVRFIKHNTEGPLLRFEALGIRSLYTKSKLPGERLHAGDLLKAIQGMGTPH